MYLYQTTRATSMQKILLQKIKTRRKLFSLILKLNHMLDKYDIENLALIPIVGKSGFASHTKHTAEVTNTDLLHS